MQYCLYFTTHETDGAVTNLSQLRLTTTKSSPNIIVKKYGYYGNRFINSIDLGGVKELKEDCFSGSFATREIYSSNANRKASEFYGAGLPYVLWQDLVHTETQSANGTEIWIREEQ